MPTRNINLTKHLKEQVQERTAKIKLLQRAAQQGFDEIDQGQGIALNSQKAIDHFLAEIESEVAAKTA
jgi:hypothetical protein